MNIERVDLNLLVYLDVLLRERNVTRAAEFIGLSQPAMSNGLRRLRELFNDPLLVRTSEGMTPTERALELQPLVREALLSVERALQSDTEFDPSKANRVFRIMVSDYTEATLIPSLLARLQQEAPEIVLDILAPSDMSFEDVERGNVDMVINRFDNLPQSFHQVTLWEDSYACVIGRENPLLENFTLGAYLAGDHVWVSKTGWGAGTGIKPGGDIQKLGWVDKALKRLGKTRKIRVYTRHYLSAMLLARQKNLIVTVPSKAARHVGHEYNLVVRQPPFPIPPIELKMAWSPLLQHNPSHRWMRRLLIELASDIDRESRADSLLD
ncbi:MAG: LysR family transcriptional regulator [Porticoccaceae bacterium]